MFSYHEAFAEKGLERANRRCERRRRQRRRQSHFIVLRRRLQN